MCPAGAFTGYAKVLPGGASTLHPFFPGFAAYTGVFAKAAAIILVIYVITDVAV